MLKRKTSISINIVSVLIILVSLFMCYVGKTNAWFTSMHKDGVEIIVNVGDLKLNLYQKFAEDDIRAVYTYKDNNKEGATEKKYISLSQKIIPGSPVNLNLILKNEDQGSAAMFLRFKFELFARGETEDTLIPTKIDGMNEKFEYKNYVENDVNSGYYYYKKSTAKESENGVFAQNAQGLDLMTSFVVDYDKLFDGNSLTHAMSETVYIKLTIDASVTDWLSDASW